MFVRLVPALALIGACSDYNFAGEDKAEEAAGEDAVPDIEVDPLLVDFGVVELSAEAPTEVVRIGNVGDALLTISGLQLADLTAPFTVTGLTAEQVPADGASELVVSFSGSEVIEAQTELLISSDDPDEPVVEVTLRVVAEEGGGSDSGVVDGCDCPDGYEARDDDSECFREVVEPAIATGDSYDVCPTTGNEVYGKYGARYPDGTTVRDSYWGDDDGAKNGRLNEIGVWGCDVVGEPTDGTNPVNTWIGFSVCLEVDEPGDYIVGLGADNRMRFSVDGTELFSQTDDNTYNFNYWWMNAVQLDAGTHVIDIEGYNAGSIGAFGAELYGPFTADSLVDDTSMMDAEPENHILWNTADAIGSAFPIGDEVLWTCPDGTEFDGCADEPECVGEEVTECV